MLLHRKGRRRCLQVCSMAEESEERYYQYHACLHRQKIKQVRRECSSLQRRQTFRPPCIPLFDQTWLNITYREERPYPRPQKRHRPSCRSQINQRWTDMSMSKDPPIQYPICSGIVHSNTVIIEAVVRAPTPQNASRRFSIRRKSGLASYRAINASRYSTPPPPSTAMISSMIVKTPGWAVWPGPRDDRRKGTLTRAWYKQKAKISWIPVTNNIVEVTMANRGTTGGSGTTAATIWPVIRRMLKAKLHWKQSSCNDGRHKMQYCEETWNQLTCPRLLPIGRHVESFLHR